jgi:hypothetical protein
MHARIMILALLVLLTGVGTTLTSERATAEPARRISLADCIHHADLVDLVVRREGFVKPRLAPAERCERRVPAAATATPTPHKAGPRADPGS